MSKFRELLDKGVLQNKPDAYTYSLLLKCWVGTVAPGLVSGPAACTGCAMSTRQRGRRRAPTLSSTPPSFQFLARQGDSVQAEERHDRRLRLRQPPRQARLQVFDTVLPLALEERVLTPSRRHINACGRFIPPTTTCPTSVMVLGRRGRPNQCDESSSIIIICIDVSVIN